MSMTPSLLNARTTTKFLTTGWTILRSDVCKGGRLRSLIGQVIVAQWRVVVYLVTSVPRLTFGVLFSR